VPRQQLGGGSAVCWALPTLAFFGVVVVVVVVVIVVVVVFVIVVVGVVVVVMVVVIVEEQCDMSRMINKHVHMTSRDMSKHAHDIM
jgi:hypothetical protein